MDKMDTNDDEHKKNDELAFDVHKITRFFSKGKGKKESEKQGKHSGHHEASSEPLTESRKEPSSHTTHHDAEEFTFSWSAFRQGISKYQVILLLLLPLFLSVYIRVQPMSFPLADQWATSTIDNAIKQQLTAQIDQQYPNLPAQNKATLIAGELNKFKESNKGSYESQRAAIAEQLRQHFKDEQGYVYMPDIDPYFYLRYARNIIEKGQIGDVVKNGVQWDNHGLAPLGGPVVHHIHPYVLAWFYKVMHVFNRDITPMQAANYFPVVFSALAVIPIFFIGRRIAGNLGGFIAATTLAIHVAAVNRTIFGHADTDAYNIFFPLVILWLFIECHERHDWRNDWKKKLALGGSAGLATGLFSYAWSGWWYIFDFILVATGLYIIYLLVRHAKQIRRIHQDKTVQNSAITLGMFILTSGIFVSLISNFAGFIRSPLQPLNFLFLKVAAKANVWPNVYTTVAELNEASLQGIIGSMGGAFLVALAALGIVLILLNKDRKDEYWLYAFTLAIWFVGTMYASTKGIRFTMLLVPPIAIGLGVAAGKLYRWTSTFAARELHVNKMIMAIVFCLLFFLLLGITPLPPFCTKGLCGSSLAAAKGDIPMINDAWYNALNKIRLESRPNAIINSWWDFGHHFKYYADRAVTFDGGSQNRPQAHWIGKVLLTGDERQAVAILRMLDCGANTAVDLIENHTGSTEKAVDLTYQLLAMDEKNATAFLQAAGMPDNKIDEVKKRMYCNAPEDYFITSDDMVGKAGVWAHFGSWNFERASIWLNTRGKSVEEASRYMKKELGYDDEQAEKTYFEVQALADEQNANSWIAPWPSYIANGGCNPAPNATVTCRLGVNNQVLEVTVNYKTKDAVFTNAQGNPRPKTLVYIDEEGFHQLWFNGTTLPHGLAIIRDGDNVQAMLMAPELTGSMFTRLFFYKGFGLKHFKPFDVQTSFVGTKVLVWKVDWEGREEPKEKGKEKGIADEE